MSRAPFTLLFALRLHDREAYARLIRDTMAHVGGHVPEAAQALGVSQRTLQRCLAEPVFADVPRMRRGPCRQPRASRRRNGQYSEGLDVVCVCGHPKGEHLAEPPYSQEDPFVCPGFRKDEASRDEASRDEASRDEASRDEASRGKTPATC